MFRELLERVGQEQRRYGSALQPPSTEQQVQRVIERARVELGAELPVEYLDLLRLTNGLDWNGVVLYGTETLAIVGHADRTIAGVIDANLGFRDDERFQDLLVLGSDGMNLYTCRISTRTFALLDEVPHELVDSTDTCDGLLSRALMRSLE
jgi:hypothetical protein